MQIAHRNETSRSANQIKRPDQPISRTPNANCPHKLLNQSHWWSDNRDVVTADIMPVRSRWTDGHAEALPVNRTECRTRNISFTGQVPSSSWTVLLVKGQSMTNPETISWTRAQTVYNMNSTIAMIWHMTVHTDDVYHTFWLTPYLTHDTISIIMRHVAEIGYCTVSQQCMSLFVCKSLWVRWLMSNLG